MYFCLERAERRPLVDVPRRRPRARPVSPSDDRVESKWHKICVHSQITMNDFEYELSYDPLYLNN